MITALLTAGTLAVTVTGANLAWSWLTRRAAGRSPR